MLNVDELLGQVPVGLQCHHNEGSVVFSLQLGEISFITGGCTFVKSASSSFEGIVATLERRGKLAWRI